MTIACNVSGNSDDDFADQVSAMILGQLGSRKPVEFFEYRRNVVKLLLSAYNSGAEIDDFLDPVKLCLGTRAVDCHTVPDYQDH